jgi:hypothetical protein
MNGIWYKEGRVVVTEELQGKREIIKHITIHQCMDTQASIGRRKSSSATTGGHNYVKMSKITYKDVLIVSATKSTIDQPRRL